MLPASGGTHPRRVFRPVFTAIRGAVTPQLAFSNKSSPLAFWGRREHGAKDSMDYRVFSVYQSKDISSWHEIPLRVEGNNTFHYLNEIPKGTRAKYEVATTEKLNPIKQDVKKGKLRFFGYGDIPFNYGCFPQTWEDPHFVDPRTGAKGDNDPVDVVEISPTRFDVGSVVGVKVLGALALLDEGETDWKIIAISLSNPLASQLDEASDIDRFLPGTTASIREWFRMYKTADGKPQNKFAFDEKILSRAEALEVIDETHHSYKSLRSGRVSRGELWLPHTTA